MTTKIKRLVPSEKKLGAEYQIREKGGKPRRSACGHLHGSVHSRGHDGPVSQGKACPMGNCNPHCQLPSSHQGPPPAQTWASPTNSTSARQDQTGTAVNRSTSSQQPHWTAILGQPRDTAESSRVVRTVRCSTGQPRAPGHSLPMGQFVAREYSQECQPGPSPKANPGPAFQHLAQGLST